MAVRCAVTTSESNRWEILFRTTEPVATREITLRFEIKTVTGANIYGEVFIGAMKIADFTGTCRVIQVDFLNAMSLEFALGTTKFTVAGVAYGLESTTKNFFVGRFRATASEGVTESDAEVVTTLPLTMPEPGDTGTGNGSQT